MKFYILKEIFHNVHSRFLDALGHLQNHPVSMDDTETTTPEAPTSQAHLKRSILSRLGEIVLSIFGVGSSGGYSTWMEKNKENVQILQQNQNLQSRQIQD